jgi:hypothetical protein
MNSDGDKKVVDPTPVEPAESQKSSDNQQPTVPTESSQPEPEADDERFGILPQRDLKKNLGCG